MAHSISGSVGSWDRGSQNRDADVRTVQTLLTDTSTRLGKSDYYPGVVDGKIGSVAQNSATVKAIIAFQRMQVRMASPDGRVDVNGKTWHTLVQAAGTAPLPTPAPIPAGTVFTVTFAHGGRIPTQTTYRQDTPATHGNLYESSVAVTGGVGGTFRGSIFPDNMWERGRLRDGSYPLHIGFHRGGGAVRQGASQLIVQSEGIRAGLLVNARNPVTVTSENPSKTTSVGVNVHNGFNSRRYSDGCPTIMPSDWERFITIFLQAYPDIDDWHTIGTNTGKQIGTLIVQH